MPDSDVDAESPPGFPASRNAAAEADRDLPRAGMVGVPDVHVNLASPSPSPLPFLMTAVAVAIPCYNEAPAIAQVITEWRAALPGAALLVLDNNSADGTGDIARGLDVRVVLVPAQGKGHVVREAFAILQDYAYVILTDGDGTYPAAAARKLLEVAAAENADMVVGNRVPVAELHAMSPVRGFGNILIRAAFRILIGPGAGDLLSGYRVFNRRFRTTVSLRSRGFEIETELVGEAIARKLVIRHVPVSYFPRIAGTQSKLRALRDGRRILRTIAGLSLRLRPLRLAGAALIVAAVLVGLGSAWNFW